MERFCIDRGLIGTERHLVVDGDLASWMTAVPSDAWHLDGRLKGDSDRCLDTVLKLSGATVDLQPPARFVKAMQLMSGSIEGPVPWQRVMPGQQHQDFIRRLVNATKAAIDPRALDYYGEVWVPGNTVFRSLERATVDGSRWRELVAAGEGNVPAVKSFQPVDGDLASPVVYDRFGTLTGRLTVRSGPQILTLKREHRNVLRSRYGDNGQVIAVDFAALEARVLLYEYGRRCDDPDLYAMIARELGQDRKAVKGAVISELYGSNKHALGKMLGLDGRELDAFVKKIKAYFRTADLLKRVKEQFVLTGHLTNRYGRRVLVDEPLDHVMTNYYAQSTGVDVTMLGFNQVVQALPPRAHPIFLLHDAMLIDVHEGDLPEVEKIDQVKVKGYVQSFPLRLERVN